MAKIDFPSLSNHQLPIALHLEVDFVRFCMSTLACQLVSLFRSLLLRFHGILSSHKQAFCLLLRGAPQALGVGLALQMNLLGLENVKM